MRNKKALGLISALSANIIWGFVSIFLRMVQDYPTQDILVYRIFISFFISALIILIFNRKAFKQDLLVLRQSGGMPKFKFWSLLLLSGLCITLNWFSFIFTVNHINVKSAAFSYMICPLITAIAGFLILKEEFSAEKLIAVVLALISVIVLASGAWGHVMWSLIIACFYATFLITQRLLKQLNRLNMLAMQLFIGLFIVVPVYFRYTGPLPVAPVFWLDIVLVAVVFTIVPLLLSLYALEQLPSSTVGILIYINPVVAFSIAIFYFQEEIKPYQLCAYVLILVAVLVFNRKIILETLMRAANQRKLK